MKILSSLALAVFCLPQAVQAQEWPQPSDVAERVPEKICYDFTISTVNTHNGHIYDDVVLPLCVDLKGHLLFDPDSCYQFPEGGWAGCSIYTTGTQYIPMSSRDYNFSVWADLNEYQNVELAGGLEIKLDMPLTTNWDYRLNQLVHQHGELLPVGFATFLLPSLESVQQRDEIILEWGSNTTAPSKISGKLFDPIVAIAFDQNNVEYDVRITADVKKVEFQSN